MEQARLRYLLCGTPRCGSSLLCEYLKTTGVAGDPQEYINPSKLRKRADLGPGLLQEDFTAFLRALEGRHSTPNGVFGIKVHFRHFAPVLQAQKDAAIAGLNGFDKVFLLRRRDKLAQAVSYYKAHQTGVWHAKAPDSKEVAFDAVAITQMLDSLVKQEQGWVRVLGQLGIHYETMDYEDTLADGRAQLMRVLGALGMDESHVPDQLKSRFARQSRENDPMVLRYKASLGVSA